MNHAAAARRNAKADTDKRAAQVAADVETIRRDLELGRRDMADELNPDLMFQGTSTALLVAIASGHVDAMKEALYELSNRGLSPAGRWVGFDEAEDMADRRAMELGKVPR